MFAVILRFILNSWILTYDYDSNHSFATKKWIVDILLHIPKNISSAPEVFEAENDAQI